MLDFNRGNISATPLSVAINSLIEAAEPRESNTRQYLGASAIGSECLRRVQYDWMVDPIHPSRIKDIFARGHFFEEVSRQHLIRIGFRFAPPERLRFEAVGGLFRGHADGILIAGLCPGSDTHACGSTRRSDVRAGPPSSVTGSKRLTRNTPRRCGYIKPISTSPSIQHFLLSSTPTRASD